MNVFCLPERHSIERHSGSVCWLVVFVFVSFCNPIVQKKSNVKLYGEYNVNSYVVFFFVATEVSNLN